MVHACIEGGSSYLDLIQDHFSWIDKSSNVSTPASSLALSSCMASLIRIPYKNFFRVGTLLTQICMKYVSKLLAGMCV